MNKKMLAMLTISTLILTATPAFASLSDDMNTLAENLQVVQKTDNVEILKVALNKMRAAAQNAQNQLPSKLEGKAPDSAEMKDYYHGYDILIGQIDSALKLTNEGKIKEAQTMVEEFKMTRNVNHKKFR